MATSTGTCAPVTRPVVRVAAAGEAGTAALAGRLALPAWAAADPGWSPLVLSWTSSDGRPVAAVLVLCRRVPGSSRFLAVLTAAPVLLEGGDGTAEEDLGAWLPAATAVLRREGAFAVRVTGALGPA